MAISFLVDALGFFAGAVYTATSDVIAHAELRWIPRIFRSPRYTDPESVSIRVRKGGATIVQEMETSKPKTAALS